MEKLNTLKNFKNYEDMSKRSEAFKKGVKDYKEGTAKIDYSIEPKWVSRVIKVREWNNYYKYNKAYCYLEKVFDGVKIGFSTAGLVPVGCEPLTGEELLSVDNYRRANNIFPTPLKIVENPIVESSKEQKKIL